MWLKSKNGLALVNTANVTAFEIRTNVESSSVVARYQDATSTELFEGTQEEAQAWLDAMESIPFEAASACCDCDPIPVLGGDIGDADGT